MGAVGEGLVEQPVGVGGEQAAVFEGGAELVGCEHPAGGVVPVQQGFGGDRGCGAQVDDGLVVQDELAVVESGL